MPANGLIPAEIVYIPTEDRARIAVKHRPCPGGQPVILLHGLAVNADVWNLPEKWVGGVHYHSLASMLHERGCDIWLVNLRGHGAPGMHSEPGPGQSDWCVDHFILYDLPAIVNHVLEHTGHRPIVVSASMGSMTLAGFLQGARLVGTGSEVHIEADSQVAKSRHDQLAGAVFTAFPAALRWPESLYDEKGRLRWRNLLRDWWGGDDVVNYPFQMLSRLGWLQTILEAAGEFPSSWTRGSLQIAGVFAGLSESHADVLLRARSQVMDHMKAGVLRQLAKSVRAGGFLSDLGSPDHVYSDHYERIELPVLVVHGARDRLAHIDVTRSVFYDRIRSTDKQFLLDPDIAHGDIHDAPIASQRLYPRILDWILAHTQNG